MLGASRTPTYRRCAKAFSFAKRSKGSIVDHTGNFSYDHINFIMVDINSFRSLLLQRRQMKVCLAPGAPDCRSISSWGWWDHTCNPMSFFQLSIRVWGLEGRCDTAMHSPATPHLANHVALRSVDPPCDTPGPFTGWRTCNHMSFSRVPLATGAKTERRYANVDHKDQRS
jgi:hypothetical protein